jgi:hypothetical protein
MLNQNRSLSCFNWRNQPYSLIDMRKDLSGYGRAVAGSLASPRMQSYRTGRLA